MTTLDALKQRLENAQPALAGYIYQQDNILVLQEPQTEQGQDLEIFIQHDVSAEQIGLQFAVQQHATHIDFLIGLTFSNQDKSYEIGAGSLKGEQRAFNLLYAFYNYPKAFYIIRTPLNSDANQLQDAIEQQLFKRPEMAFLESAVKTNALGEKSYWMKSFIVQEAMQMQARLQAVVAE